MRSSGGAGRSSVTVRHRPPWRLAAAAVALLLTWLPAGAPGEELVGLDPERFPVADELKPHVAFWVDVFSRYTSRQVLLHDEWEPDRVYAVLDFSALEASEISDVAKARRRRDAARKATEKYRSILQDLAAGRDSAYADDARRVAGLFDPEVDRGAFRAAAQRLRTQTGLKDVFNEAIVRSGRYLPAMERIFSQRGLPTELTRLPFVESMFQEQARSKAAAGGMWQIMASTGRRHLHIGLDVDERYDPLLAAEAAASLLKENYYALGTWPLAITAYNYGKNGLARAVRQLGTRDLGVIVHRHRGRTFGFASRNFYSEFVAATLLYENRQRFFPGVEPAPPLAFDEVALEHYVPARELAEGAQGELEVLEALNPAISREVWSGRLLLPAGYRLRVPAGQGESFHTAYAALPAELKAGRQAGFYYKVHRGDTLSGIARRYGTSVTALVEVNGLRSRHYLRVGQTLYVPPGRSWRGGGTGVHIVRRGETLSAIARRYGTTVQALVRANGLASSNRIYPGQRLAIAK